jgi:Ca-activated chloride channel family protein
MTDIQFATPALLLLLPVVLLIALLPLYARERTRPPSLRFASTFAARTGSRSLKLRLRPFIPVLRWLALALLIIAAARPQTTDAREILRGEGIDITLALDISGSMAAFDFDPINRLEAAKQVIYEFIERREYDRIGLIVFASEAFVHSPPTVDHDALLFLLEEVNLASVLRLHDGTAVGMGLAVAANMLKDSESESKVIVLLTDGVNNSGDIDPLTAAAATETLGIRAYTIGMGNPDDRLGPLRSGFIRGDLDEETLRQIADSTGGKYFRATDTDGLRTIYEEIDKLEKSEVEVSIYAQHRELAGWFLLAAPVLLLLEILAHATIFRPIP